MGTNDKVRILGIDPGSRITGFGIVEAAGSQTRPIKWGGIKTTGDHVARLKCIYRELGVIVAEYQPDEIAVERVFMHRNADSALKLGQARAAALCASFTLDVPVFEYAARHIKKALVGQGSAEKAQVQTMIKIVLGIRDAVDEDAADALAVAICHAHERGTRALIEAVAT